MNPEEREALFDHIRKFVEKSGYKRSEVEDAIRAAHNGRPDGYLVTNDNQWMFRRYRNYESPNPKQLVAEALKKKGGEA
jgi:hypothetical protein